MKLKDMAKQTAGGTSSTKAQSNTDKVELSGKGLTLSQMASSVQPGWTPGSLSLSQMASSPAAPSAAQLARQKIIGSIEPAKNSILSFNAGGGLNAAQTWLNAKNSAKQYQQEKEAYQRGISLKSVQERDAGITEQENKIKALGKEIASYGTDYVSIRNAGRVSEAKKELAEAEDKLASMKEIQKRERTGNSLTSRQEALSAPRVTGIDNVKQFFSKDYWSGIKQDLTPEKTGDERLDNWSADMHKNANAARMLANTYGVSTDSIGGSLTQRSQNEFDQRYKDLTFGERMKANVGNTALGYGASAANAALTAANTGLAVADRLTGGKASQNQAVQSIYSVANFAQNAASGMNQMATQDMQDASNWLGKLVLNLETTMVEQGIERIVAKVSDLLLPGSGEAAAMAMLGIRTFGSGAQEAEDRGENLWQQWKTGAARGGTEVGTEMLGGIGGSWRGTGYGDAAFKKLDKWVATKTGSELLGTLASAYGSEMWEEILADIVNPIWDRIFGIGVVTGRGEDKTFSQKLIHFFEDVWGDGQLLYDGLLGGLAGALGGGGSFIDPVYGIPAQAKNLSVDIATYKAAQRIVTSNKMRNQFQELTGVELAEDENTALVQAAVYLTNVSESAGIGAREAETNIFQKRATGNEVRSAQLAERLLSAKDVSDYIDNVFEAYDIDVDDTTRQMLVDGYDPRRSSLQSYAFAMKDAYMMGSQGYTLEQTINNSKDAAQMHPDLVRHAWQLGNSQAQINEGEFFGRFGEDADAVKEVYQARTDGIALEQFAPAYTAAFNAGKAGVALESAKSADSRTSVLSDAELQAAWELGSKADERDTARRMETTQTAAGIAEETRIGGKVSAEDGIKFSDMNSAQKTAVRVLRFIAKGTGVNVVLYDGTKGGTVTDKTGKKYFTSDNGYFDPKTNTIHIDISAGVNTEEDIGKIEKYTMLRTFAHEYTHFIEHNAANRYRELRAAVFARMAEKGQNPVDLIERKMAEDSTLSYDGASREVIADAMSDMLEDSTFAQILARENRSLFDSIREQLHAFVSRIRAAFQKMNPNEDIGAKTLKETVNGRLRYLDDILKLWDNAALEAARNYNTAKNTESTAAETERDEKAFSRREKALNLSKQEISAIQGIGMKSVNQFNSNDTKTVERLARQYWTEMGTKSPFFRAWFGDWRVNDQTPVAVANKQGGNRGTQHNDDTGWDINISKTVFVETNTHRGSAIVAARPYLPYIEDIIKKAVLLDTFGLKNSKSPNSLLMHSLYAVSDIGNGPEVIKLFVEEMNDPNKEGTGKRAYQLRNIKSQQLKQNGSPKRVAISSTASINKIADLFDYVKTNDPEFRPNPVSAVVDEEGAPMVVYHGTDADFTVFDRTKGRSTMDIQGSFFSPYEIEAEGYGSKVGAYYLSLKNPASEGEAYKALNRFKGQNKAGEKARQYLESLGYDGVAGYDEYVAFNPEQIKSATENRGTFDSGDPDYQHSRRVPSERGDAEVISDDDSIIGASETITDVTEAVQHSYRSLAQAAGFTAVRGPGGEKYWVSNEERVSKVTEDDIRHSPIGAMIMASVKSEDFTQGITEEEAKKQIKFFSDICNMAATTRDFAMVMKFAGSAAFTAMKANSDVQYGTTYDFPSICTKTQAMIDAMSAYMVKQGRGMSREEILDLYRKVFASGNPVPCPECYVFSRWIGIGGLLDNIQKYQDKYCSMSPEDVMAEYRKFEGEINAFAEEHNLSFGKAKGKLAERYEKLRYKIEKAENQGMKVKESDRRLLEELEPQHTTLKAMTWIRDVYFGGNLNAKKMNQSAQVPVDVLFDLNAGDAFATRYPEAWDFRTTQGAGYGKAITPYAEAVIGEGIMITNSQNFIDQKKEYARETGEVIDNPFLHPNPDGTLPKKAMAALKNARAKMKAQNFRGGQRYSSTSDARPDTFSDFLLAALETQAMQGMVQVYTKVTGAVDAYNDWGFSTNLSLMPKFGGLDADGYIIDTPVGGMNPRTAETLRNRNELAGTITIGVNDEHIRKMMNDGKTRDRNGKEITVMRDFIIPYHASGGQAETVDLMRQIQEGQNKGTGAKIHSTDYTRTQGDKILSDDALRNVGPELWGRQLTDEDIDLIHRRRAARIAILCGKANVDMDVVRGSRFLSALYDKFNGGEWTGVKNPKSKVEHQIYPNEFWDKSVSYEDSGKITRDYLDYCEELGFLHRFSGRVVNGKAGLSWSSGYDKDGKSVKLTDLAYEADENGMPTDKINGFFWKVLTDRRMYGANGQYLEQQVANLSVTPTSLMPSVNLKVGEFAKAVDESREYDKGISDRLVEEIRNGEKQRSMRVVPPAEPSSNQWQSGHSEAWFRENGFPIREDVSEDWLKARMAKGWTEGKKPYDQKGFSGSLKSEGTQIKTTEKTYAKIFNYLKGQYPDTYKTMRVLDASSGLGLGTKAGLDMGFDVTDIEPYVHPDSDYFPDYMDYSSLQEKVESGEVEPFDFIISNAVLNVIPQDTRDNMVDWFGSVLAPGGQLYVNTLDANYTKGATPDVQRDKKGKITGSVLTQSGDYTTPGAKKGNEVYVAGSQSVQKGFSNDELRAYLRDALGSGYRVESPTFKAGSGATAVATKIDTTQHSRRTLTQGEQKYYDANQKRSEPGQNLYTLQGSVTGRYRGNVGKQVGDQTYLHKNYATEVIPTEVYQKAQQILEEKYPNFNYNCLMYEPKKNTVRFDEAPDFDTAREPIPGDTVSVNYATGDVKTGHSEKIWHHKWEWVKNDYTGFNVEEAWNWSKRFLSTIRKVDEAEHVFEYKFNQRGIANGTSNGYDAWNEQLEYFDLPTDNIQHQRRTSTYSNLEVLEMAADRIETKDQAVRDALTVFQKHVDNVKAMQQQKAQLSEQISEADPNEAKDLIKKRDALDRKLLKERDALLKMEKTSVLRRILTQARNIVETEERNRGNEKLREYREKRNESAGVAKYRKQVIEKAGKLYEMLLKNDDKVHVPEVLKQPLGELLESIDFSSKRSLAGGAETQADQKFGARLMKLQQMLENQQRYLDGDSEADGDLGGYIDVSPEMMDYLRNMSDLITTAMNTGRTFTVNQMSAEDLKTLSNFLGNLRTAINNMNRFMANARYETVREAAAEDIENMKKLGSVSGAGTTAAAKLATWQNGTPYYIFKRYGKGGEAIFDGLTRGWEKLSFNAREIIEFTEDLYTDKEVKEWTSQIHDITLEDGSTIKITTGQIMSLAMLINREQALKHMNKGGARIGDIKQKGVKGTIQDLTQHHFTDTELQKIIGTLTPRQLEVAQKLQKYMATKGAEWGNEISMRRFGYNFYEEGENYFPIRTMPTDRPMADTDAQQNSMFRLLNLSASKSLNPKANNALVIDDIFDVFSDHMADMAKLNGMGLPILDAIKWFNYKEKLDNGDGTFNTETMQAAMQTAFGDQAGKYFKTLIKDINGMTESGDRGTNLPTKLLSNYKIASVAANLRVALLQPTAYVRAMTVLSPKYMIGNIPTKAAYEEALKYSGTAGWKDLGYYETDISRGLREKIKHDDTVRDKIAEASMKPAEFGDQMTWATLWQACKRQAKAQNPDAIGNTLMQKTADLFREVVYSSQVMDSTLTRSEIMRGKTMFTKGMSAFMAEPTLSYNILMDAFSKYNLDVRKNGKAGAWQRNSAKLGRALGVYVCSATFAALVESIADAFRDDDDEEFLEKFTQAFFGEDGKILSGNFVQDLSVLGKIPYVKNFISTLQGYRSTDMSVAALTSVMDVFNIWSETIKLANGELEKATKTTYYGKMTEWGKIYKTLQALSQLSGFAVSNATRDVIAIWNTIMNGRRDDWKIRTYDGGKGDSEEDKIKNSLLKGKMTEQEAVKALMDTGKNSKISQITVDKWQWEQETGVQYSKLDDAYKAGEITRQQAVAGMKAAGKSDKDIQKAIEDYDFEKKYGAELEGYNLTTAQAKAYYNNGLQNRISLDEYAAQAEEYGTTVLKGYYGGDNPGFKSIEDYAAFQSIPVHSDKKGKAAELVVSSGINVQQYASYLESADTDGNGSVKQDELGAVLKSAIGRNEITQNEAEKIWYTLWQSKNTFAKWARKH